MQLTERPDQYIAEVTEELSAKSKGPAHYFRLLPIDLFQVVRIASCFAVFSVTCVMPRTSFVYEIALLEFLIVALIAPR